MPKDDLNLENKAIYCIYNQTIYMIGVFVNENMYKGTNTIQLVNPDSKAAEYIEGWGATYGLVGCSI